MDTSNRWVLVVEDNPDDELLARRAFAGGSRPETLRVVNTGEDALEALKADTAPALILMDLKLPRLSGVELIMAFRDDARFKTVPIVVLTSSDEVSNIAACYELGCNAYVRKPIDYHDFLNTLSATLEFWLAINVAMPERLPAYMS